MGGNLKPKKTSRGKSSGSFVPIVGIGASAGGLYSLKCFLKELPKKFGFAIVFMQHLSPKHKSLLPELLRTGKPDLEIKEISEGQEILPGSLYLCPPGKEIGIREGSFHVAPPSGDDVHLPIDEFFISLAEEAGERAVAVIFSGAGTDGARGIQSIRSMGGTVFVQDPATAEFTGMPLAAISTGRADGVFPPEDIAREIIKIYGSLAVPEGRDNVISPSQFEAFYRLIREKTGYRFNHYKKSVVGRRIRRRMCLRGLTTVQDYIQIVAEKDPEADSLAADLMIGVTSFFRDRLAWKALKMEVIRKFASADDDSPVRVWTPACSTGEEAYSIAMMLHHEFELAGRKREIRVFASDANDRALERAREGKYPGSIVADVPPDYMKRFFACSKDGLSVIINKDIRERVVFARQDILTDPPFSKLDLIICRNFLIYLEPEAQEKCITLFHYALKDGGYLFLGNAESAGRDNALFRSLGHKKCRVYRKAETKPSSRVPLAVPFAAERAAPLPARQATAAEDEQSLTGFVQETLLEKYAPAAIAINQNYDILYHNGPTNRYLRQPRGTPTQNLLEIIPENLRSRVRGAIYRAAQDARPVSVRASLPADAGRKRQVTLRISRLRENLYLIVFRERRGVEEKAGTIPAEAAGVDETAVRQLETELSAMRADLQSHTEEFQSANEELQSANEELQAANEELETSREELQSLNEELVTVNSQLQTKIEEQEETNNDLNNFLASTNIPTVFLDDWFRVKRFTPAMSRLIKLIPADVGRPIVDMSQENLGPDLIADARAVLDNLVPIKKEIAINGTWYVRATLPYRTADNRIEGVVVTYSDVTELKRAEERTRHLASFPQLNPNPVLEVAASGAIVFSNAATQKVLESLGMDNDDATVFLPYDIDSILRALEKKEEAALYREVSVKDRVFGETVHLVPQFGVLRIYTHDITDHKRAEEALRESEERFRLLVEGVKDYAIFMLDPEGKVVTWNEGAERLKGYKAEEIIGKHFSLFYKPEDIAVHKPDQELKTAVTAGKVEDEGWRVRKDGSLFRASVVITAVRDDTGILRGFAKVTRDITERKRAEEALLESEQRVRLKLDSILSPGGDIGNLELADIIDARGVQSLMNDFYKLAHMPMSIIDLKGRLLVGIGWQEICMKFHRVHPETCRNCIESDLQLSAGVPPGEFKLYKCKNNMWDVATPIIVGGKQVGNLFMGQFFFEGEPLDYELFRSQAKEYGFDEKEYIAALEAVPRLSKEDLNASMAFFLKLAEVLSKLSYSNIKLARSLAERDCLMESLTQANTDLAEVNKELEVFSYTVSHDLRAPLRSIEGFTTAITEDYAASLDQTANDYFNRVISASRRMSQLIDSMLNMARLTKGQLRERSVNLSDIAEVAVSELGKKYPDRRVEHIIAKGVMAQGDIDMLRIVIENLFDNAWKFTSRHEYAKIEFGVIQVEGKDVYFVRDDGAGFNMDYADKLFLPFRRLHSESEFPGLGIGLATVQKIINRHGGKIWADSAPEKETTFYFTLE
jgi:two-component system CheB/CheR fusion protein